MNIHSTIRRLRDTAGIRQGELAARAGITQSYLSLIESGKKDPSLEVLEAIAQGIGVPVPILVFLALDDDDVRSGKDEVWARLAPSVRDLIEQAITNELATDDGKEAAS